MQFIVRQYGGSEKAFRSVQEAFSTGQANQQDALVRETNVRYPAVYVEDEEGRRYGPVLRP